MTTSYRNFWEPINDSSWGHFRRTYWGARGKALLKDLRDKPPLERFLHVEQPVVRDAFSMNGTGDAVFVREEFLLFAERVRNARNMSSLPGVLLLGQPGIGKSLFLLFLLVQCLAREEPALFTSRFGNTYLFDKDGVAKVATTNFDPTICLPNAVDSIPRLLSLVDWPSTKALPYSVTCCLTALFSVIDPSSDPACYQKLRRQAKFPCWWMSPWSPEELHALFRIGARYGFGALARQRDPDSTTFAPAARQLYPTLDVTAFRSLASTVGPSPRDIFSFLSDPAAHDRLVDRAVHSFRGELTALGRHFVREEDTFSTDNADAVFLATPIQNQSTSHDQIHSSTAVFTRSDRAAVEFRSRAVYERTLDSFLTAPPWGPSASTVASGTRWLYSVCESMPGRQMVGILPFLFDHFAALYTMGQSSLVDDGIMRRHRFVPMAPLRASVDSEEFETSHELRFVYQSQWDSGPTRTNVSTRRDRPPTLVVDNDDKTGISWHAQPTSPSPGPAQALASASAQSQSPTPAPWRARQRVPYENIDDLAELNASTYYAPAASVRERDGALRFNAFFFQEVPVPPAAALAHSRSGSRSVVVLWLLQIAAKRGPRVSAPNSYPNPTRASTETLNVDPMSIRRLRERARQVWPAPSWRRVEVKHVLAVPHCLESEKFDVEWRLPRASASAEGEFDDFSDLDGPPGPEAFVQFLDVSAFCAGDRAEGRAWPWDGDGGRCGVEDVLGAHVPKVGVAGASGAADGAVDVDARMGCKRVRGEKPGGMDDKGREMEGGVEEGTPPFAKKVRGTDGH